MEQIEQTPAGHGGCAGEAQGVRGGVHEGEGDSGRAGSGPLRGVGGLGRQQKACSAQVEKTLLARYNKLKTTRKDQALALLKDGICLGCRLQLPPQLVSQVKRAQDVHTCPYCHRMLYWEGEPATEAKRTTDSDQAEF